MSNRPLFCQRPCIKYLLYPGEKFQRFMAFNFRRARQILSPKRLLVRLNIQLSNVEEKCVQRHWRQLSNIDRMIVVLEDKRYLRHRGVDWRSVLRIAVLDLFRRRRGGASTIEMQLIRTVLNARQKTISRKLNEFVLAWLLNFRLDKLSILVSYENLAFFGSHLEGADAASQLVFKKAADELSLEEAAFVAAMLVYPRPNVETKEWRCRVERRASYGISIYRRLEERGEKITK